MSEENEANSPSAEASVLRARLRAELVVMSPMRIGAADDAYDPERSDSLAVASLTRDANGQPYLPGSSLRGWLRAQVLPDHREALFGYRPDPADGGGDGHVDVLDAFVLKATERVEHDDAADIEARRYGHERDPVTAAVSKRKLFAREVVQPGTRFELTLFVHRCRRSALDALFAALRVIDGQRESALGAARQGGLGRMSLEALSGEELDEGAVRQWLDAPAGDSPWKFARAMVIPAMSAAAPRWRPLPLALYSLGPFLCEDAAARPEATEGWQPQSTKRPLLTVDGQSAVVPGASLKGALRAIARRVLLSEFVREGEADVEAKADAVPEPKSVSAACERALSELFGDTASASRVAVSDFIGSFTEHERTLHASDRFTGGVSGGRLYTVHALCGTRLDGDLAIDERRLTGESGRALALLLATTLREAWYGPLALGWGATRGFGEMRLAARGDERDTSMESRWIAWITEHLPEVFEPETDACFAAWRDRYLGRVDTEESAIGQRARRQGESDSTSL